LNPDSFNLLKRIFIARCLRSRAMGTTPVQNLIVFCTGIARA
jgi:hypothetical protein